MLTSAPYWWRRDTLRQIEYLLPAGDVARPVGDVASRDFKHPGYLVRSVIENDRSRCLFLEHNLGFTGFSTLEYGGDGALNLNSLKQIAGIHWVF